MAQRIRIGYMRVKEVIGLMEVRIRPISWEEAMRLLKGGSRAGQGHAEG